MTVMSSTPTTRISVLPIDWPEAGIGEEVEVVVQAGEAGQSSG